jgi:hypothetical protein
MQRINNKQAWRELVVQRQQQGAGPRQGVGADTEADAFAEIHRLGVDDEAHACFVEAVEHGVVVEWIY